jgi:hypothetical protein
MVSRAYAVFEIEGSERPPSIQKLLESCGAKHGTALLSHQTSAGLTPQPDQCPLQSHGHQMIKRLARTDARSVCCPCRKSCSGGRSPLLKNQKREARHAKQDSDRPGVAAASAASLEQASPTINRIAPLARNFRCHPDAGADVRGQINARERFAALESGVHAAADAARKAAVAAEAFPICGGSRFSVVDLNNKAGGTNG